MGQTKGKGSLYPTLLSSLSLLLVHIRFSMFPVRMVHSEVPQTSKAREEPDKPYGRRLMPQIFDASAAKDPTRLVAKIARSTDISQGFIDITIGNIVQAIDFMARWMDENVGMKRDFSVVAYLVSQMGLKRNEG